MKKLFSPVKKRLVSKYLNADSGGSLPKSTDVNILLNRVRLDNKREKLKKLIFSAIASTSIIVFGILVF